jgi:hypothetical protein
MAIENRIAKFLSDDQVKRRQQQEQFERDAAIVDIIAPHVAEIVTQAREGKWDDAKLTRVIAWVLFHFRKPPYVQ